MRDKSWTRCSVAARLSLLCLLLLPGCDLAERERNRESFGVDASWNNLEQQEEIDRLEREVDALERSIDLERELRVGVQDAVTNNARIANENSKLGDDRWKAYLNHSH